MVWRLWGDGPPLVLLHGGHGSWTHWLRNIPVLAEHFTTIVPDLPGYGDSDLPSLTNPVEAEALAAIVAAGLDRVVPPPATYHLVGFSSSEERRLGEGWCRSVICRWCRYP